MYYFISGTKRTTRSHASRFGNLPDPVAQSEGIVSPLKINLQTMKVKQNEAEKQRECGARVSSNHKNHIYTLIDYNIFFQIS